MAVALQDILPEDDIDIILSLPEVLDAKTRIDAITSGSIRFSSGLSQSLRTILQDRLELDFSKFGSIPMRWIKGDIQPHIDRGVESFDTTTLVYLTDSPGKLIVNEDEFPILKGTAYRFPEASFHKTIGTGSEPRLLLGPMSEKGFAVGEGGTSIYLDPGQTAYIREDSGLLQFSLDQSLWQNIDITTQVFVGNNNPSEGTVFIQFITDITITNANTSFICNTDNIQFGSTSLNPNGSRPVITVAIVGIDGEPPLSYGGLIINGFPYTAHNNIKVFNLIVDGSASSLTEGAGWIGSLQFGENTSGNFIVNCKSIGAIPTTSGGIVGQNAGQAGTLTIIGCSSSGTIGIEAGGIVGKYGGFGGTITCEKCWSEGSIGDYAGGIFGKQSGNNGGQATASRCYSIGTVSGISAGGIFGQLAGTDSSSSAIAQVCYSRGPITGDSAGGIYGGGAASDGGTTNAINCYSSGTLAPGNTGYGIYSGGIVSGRSQSSCYAAGGTWNNTVASSSLQNPPSANGVSSTWVYKGIATPYEINGLGYTPYTLEIITSTPDLNQTFSQTVAQGQSGIKAVTGDASGNDFDILNLDEMTTVGISMNGNSGAISTTSSTPLGTYTIYVRSIGSYNTTQFSLTVTDGVAVNIVVNESGVSCCEIPLDLKNADYEQRNKVISGNTIIGDTAVRRIAYTSYGALYNLKMAYASKR